MLDVEKNDSLIADVPNPYFKLRDNVLNIVALASHPYKKNQLKDHEMRLTFFKNNAEDVVMLEVYPTVRKQILKYNMSYHRV
ncbi:unnamed protein product [Allacma fusca]|uniref:Uncharacterized protein n=1 Tax=Allacma fusca TaxID=39272 RepID=A0A8J2PN88_9HEXA|nr:unnamed protein product [Allacma fusca]